MGVVTLLFFCHGESDGFSRLFINLVSLSFVGHGGKRGWFCCVSVVRNSVLYLSSHVLRWPPFSAKGVRAG